MKRSFALSALTSICGMTSPAARARLHRKRFRTFLSCGALLIAAVHAAAQAPLRPEGTCAINRVDGAFGTGGFVELTGFAIDSREGAPVAKVIMILDHVASSEATLRGLRPDVLAAFARADFLWSGWSGKVSLEHVRPGVHEVSAVAVTRSGKEIACGTREVHVVSIPEPPARPSWRIALEILFRAGLLVAWLAFIGLTPALLTGRSPVALRSPVLGLALFGVAAEGGSVLGLRPARSAAVLTVVCAAGLALLLAKRRARIRLAAAPGSLQTFAFAAIFAVVGVIPFASHGDGAVLGDIDDAIRECAVADSLTRWGGTPPAGVRGYLAAVPAGVRKVHMRLGGAYLLSAASQTLGVRAYVVHGSAMLAAGCLAVLATGLLAHRILRRFPRKRWIPVALVAVNSTLLAMLYGQHLGTLLFTALFLGFLFHLLALARGRNTRPVAAVGLLIAGCWTFYPEGIATWVLAALLTLLVVDAPGRRERAWLRLLAAALIAAILNPIGMVRGARSLTAIAQASELSSPYAREIAGDTHYFPSVLVIAGLEAHREDASAPVGYVRSLLIPIVAVLILIVAWLGWRALSGRERSNVVLLLLPPAAALYLNWRLQFPYGFSKYLPLAVPLWAIVFTLLALRAGERSSGRRRAILGRVSLACVALLSLPAARHVVKRAVLSVPSLDPAFRVLPALGAAVGRDTVIQVEEPLRARREWIQYFLGENAVDPEPPDDPPYPGLRRVRLVDRRNVDGSLPGQVVVASRFFALIAPEGREGEKR